MSLKEFPDLLAISQQIEKLEKESNSLSREDLQTQMKEQEANLQRLLLEKSTERQTLEQQLQQEQRNQQLVQQIEQNQLYLHQLQEQMQIYHNLQLQLLLNHYSTSNPYYQYYIHNSQTAFQNGSYQQQFLPQQMAQNNNNNNTINVSAFPQNQNQFQNNFHTQPLPINNFSNQPTEPQAQFISFHQNSFHGNSNLSNSLNNNNNSFKNLIEKNEENQNNNNNNNNNNNMLKMSNGQLGNAGMTRSTLENMAQNNSFSSFSKIKDDRKWRIVFAGENLPNRHKNPLATPQPFMVFSTLIISNKLNSVPTSRKKSFWGVYCLSKPDTTLNPNWPAIEITPQLFSGDTSRKFLIEFRDRSKKNIMMGYCIVSLEDLDSQKKHAIKPCGLRSKVKPIRLHKPALIVKEFHEYRNNEPVNL